MGLTTKHFSMYVKGLKPETVHKFYYEGVDNTDKCKALTGPEINTTVLKTDKLGGLAFSFNLSVNQSQTYHGGFLRKRYTSYRLDISGTKKFELRATDSSATTTVLFADL